MDFIPIPYSRSQSHAKARLKTCNVKLVFCQSFHDNADSFTWGNRCALLDVWRFLRRSRRRFRERNNQTLPLKRSYMNESQEDTEVIGIEVPDRDETQIIQGEDDISKIFYSTFVIINPICFKHLLRVYNTKHSPAGKKARVFFNNLSDK